jgi:GMP synthase (glutamine-hydrolysing)
MGATSGRQSNRVRAGREPRAGSERWLAVSARLLQSPRVSDVLIVKTGTTLAPIAAQRGDFEAWIGAGLGVSADRVRVVAVYDDERLPPPGELAGAVVTGSSAMVSEREPWSEATAAWLAGVIGEGMPLLGICYGHQLLAHALGGEVSKNPLGREIGSIDVALTPEAVDDALLGDWPATFRAQASHVESVLALPPGCVRLATTALDPNHAFRVGDSAWGVQFHPEFDADITRGYLRGRRAAIEDEGGDVDRLIAGVAAAPHAAAVLARFAELLRD